MNKNYFGKGCIEVVRNLARLVDQGRYMTRNEFHKLCEEESFLRNLQKEYPDTVKFDFFNPDSSLFIKENYKNFNEALCSYANVTVMEDYGLENNALLLAINFCIAILDDEASDA